MRPDNNNANEPVEETKAEGDQPLFRHEVIEAQQTQWLGSVLLAPSITHKIFALFAITTAAAVLGLLFFADYSRTENVSGWLVPQQGLVRIYSPRAGVVSQLDIKDGEKVGQGATLLNISSELQTVAVGATQEEVVRRLQQRLSRLRTERKMRQQLYDKQIKGVANRLLARKEERQRREQELSVQRELVELSDSNAQRLKAARDSGALSGQSWLDVESTRLDQLMALRVLERELSVFGRERMSLEEQNEALPLERETELSVIDRRIDELAQELAEAESRRQIVVKSPQSGTVTSLQVKLGGTVTPELPMLSIVPEGSDLEAQLFVPTRAIGFIRKGQQVQLRFRAFPYQKFGHYEGTIASVSRSTLSPSELSPHVSSVSNPSGSNDPVYSIKVKLAQQHATAYGEAIALQPGMQLDANVFIEKRRLIDWVLDPLYTLTGSKQG